MKLIEVKTLTQEEQDKVMAKYASLSFANLKKNIVQDLLNNRNESAIYKRYDKEQVVDMLENPQRNEKEIRELSRFLYMVSSHYRRLVDYIPTILLYNYSVIPYNILPKKPIKSKFKEDYYSVVSLCNKFNLKHESEKMMTIAVRDGVFYGLCYESDDSFYVKPFNEKYAKISSIEDGCYRPSIDMAYFQGKEYLLEMYGNDFVRAYEAYKGNPEKGIEADRTKKWYEPENGICIKSDESDPVYSLPLFTGLLLDVLSIDDYKMLQKAKTESDNYKALSAKLPLDADGMPLMDFPTAQKYYSQMASNLPEGVGLLLSPFDVDEYNFKTSTASDTNAATEAEGLFWEAAGVSSLIFGSTKATSSSSLALSVKPDEALAYSFLQQIERFFNRKIKKLNLSNYFKLEFSQQSIFNQDEYINRLSKAASLGVPVKMQYASSLGLSPSDVLGMTYLEEDILSLANKTWNKPLISSNTQSTATSTTSEGGRPTAEETGEQIGDAGEQTRNTDANDNR